MKNFHAILAAISALILFCACGSQPPSELSTEQELALNTSYSTSFDLTENPISEGGQWINGNAVGIDWTNVKTVGGIAKGNPNFPDWWRDSTALLTGSWAPDQTATATIWCQPAHSDDHMETELRLRSALSAHSCTGYEVLFNCNSTSTAYMYIVRWNGPEQDFTILTQQTGSSWGVKNGDVVKASVVGNVIKAFVNGVQKMSATDSVYANGAPGIGFDHNATGSNDDFGFSDYSVTATGGVTQTLTSITVSPSSASVAAGSTRQFSATALDQTGAAMSPQPSFTWSVSGGGSISTNGLFTAGSTAGGPFTVTAASGGKSGTASVSVTAVVPAVARDDFESAGWSGGTGWASAWAASSTNAAVTSSGVAHAGTNHLRLLSSNGLASRTVNLTGVSGARLQFWWKGNSFETGETAAVIVNDGSDHTVLTVSASQADNAYHYADIDLSPYAKTSNFKITFDANMSGTGDYFYVDDVVIAGTAGGGGSNQAPTVATAATASPNPATGTTSTLSVLGADDAGEPQLTYTWAATTVPSGGTATFSVNGTNAAKNTVATFNKAGNYSLQATIKDAGNLTAVSSVNITVNATLSTVSVSPASASVVVNGTQAFTASAKDQFGTALSAQPAFTWAVSGGGSINSSGLFTAGATAGGPFTVTASSGGKSGTASVSVTAVSGGGSHTLKIVLKAPVDYIAVDKFEYYNGSTWVAVQETASAVSYVGTWAADLSDCGNGIKTAGAANDAAQFAFTGTGVRWYNDGWDSGSVDVYIDGVFQKTVATVANTCGAALQYEKTGL